MRSNYPLSSKELQDKFDIIYEHIYNLLGTDNVSGLYDYMEEVLIQDCFVGKDIDQNSIASGVYNLENEHQHTENLNKYNKNIHNICEFRIIG